ncbi:MAG: DUF1810 domain-containing protein [Chitinophagaceae bacterium]
MTHSLKKFIDAQSSTYEKAFTELKNGKKQGHWIWFIFPQIAGLGFSETSKFYSIKDIGEARAYLADPSLGPRLIEISNVLLTLGSNDALKIFGSPDNLKLKSSMTLFSTLETTHEVFDEVLLKFFNGERDEKTLNILRNQK